MFSSLFDKSLPKKRSFQRSLLKWYSSYKRDLPWRKNRDPYRILVSEFMLQRTRVETVISYFERFLKIFPSLRDLARASLPKVLKAWAGLGYYARARHLHAAAKIIYRNLDGKIPAGKAHLLDLPGFGPYTAGAVASLAFNEPVAAVDGNVRRILGRLLAWEKNSSGKSGQTGEEFVQDLIPPGRAADFNQALMDLGAGICTPAGPRCPLCPVRKFCATKGAVRKNVRRAKKIREEVWAVALIEKEGRFLLQRNKEKGLLGGLWQFPKVVLRGKDKGEVAMPIQTLRKVIGKQFRLNIRVKSSLPEQELVFTHIQATIKPFLCSLIKAAPDPLEQPDLRWVKPANFFRYPISTGALKIAAPILNPSGRRISG